jgi:Flp pilus assembly protein TadG
MWRKHPVFDRFIRRFGTSQGQALIEFALSLPLLLLLIVNVVNFGGFFYAWITVANAARAGADYAVLNGASVGSLDQLTIPTGAQIVTIIQNETSSLPNASSLTIGVCQNNNGTISVLAGTCTSAKLDPENPAYILTTVQVAYTYKPFISAGFQFPGLNVYATLPPLTITRVAYMRLLG